MKTSWIFKCSQKTLLLFSISSISFFSILVFSTAAEAGPAAMGSLRGLADVINAVHTTEGRQPAFQPAVYRPDCDGDIENLRVDVAIFGDNNLDDMREVHGMPNQCYSPIGRETPPAGRIILERDGRSHFIGSAQTVHREDIIVTAAHLFWRDGEPRIRDTDRIYFEVFVGSSENCRVERYEVDIDNMIVGSESPQSNRENDFAVLRLDRPMTAYYPLELPPNGLTARVVAEETDVNLVGFVNHESTNNGRDISVVMCKSQTPPEDNFYHQGRTIFFHDCDALPGMSGAAMNITYRAPEGENRTFTRYFVGMQVSDVYEENRIVDEFDPHRNYNISVLAHERLVYSIRQMANQPIAVGI